MLPQYEIVSMLGHGGMGAVYKGKQISLDRMVAIKILPPGLDDDDAKFTERFRNEARTMARMNHPGIVSVYDFGETAEGQFYFVMEYVDGTDVAKMIQSSKKLPPNHALAITAHVCDALGYAHANGVIHRDIKPANILINMQGQVKVADFGLAKQDDPSMTSGLTKTGMAMGTPDFVAPEALVMGVNVDGRADLYAIGVMLYQMLTGDIPRGLFLMPSVKTNGEIDPRFDKIITRAMQTDREERYQKASEIRKDLDVILTAPRVKQDATKAVAAVPQGAVKNVPGQRSAAPGNAGLRPAPGGPQARAPRDGAAAAAKPDLKSQSSGPKPKSKTGLYIGIAAGIAVIGGAAFMFSDGKPVSDANSGGADNASSQNESLVTSSPTTSGPIKVVEPPKPPIAKSDPKPVTTAGTTNSDGWTDGLAEWLAVPGNVARDTLKPYGAVWRWAGPEAVFLGGSPAGKSLANVAVRLTFKHGGRSTVAIKLRIAKTSGFNYTALVRPDGGTEIKLWKDEKDTLLAKFDPIPGFDHNASHVMEFRALGDVLTLLLDGQTRGSVKDATLATGSFSISFGTIEKIEYRDLSSAAAVAESARVPPAPPAGSQAASASSDGWIDGLAEWLAVPANASKSTLQKEGDGWRYKGPESISLGARLSPPYKLDNVAVRLTSKGGPGSIALRDQGGDGNHYLAVQSYPDFVEIRRSQNKESTTLAKFKLPPGFKQGASYVMEFHAEGEALTVMVNGQTLGSIKDSTYSSGKFHVSPLNALIDKLEYRDLGSAAVAPAAAPSAKDSTAVHDGGVWADALAEYFAKSTTDGRLVKEAGGARVTANGGTGFTGSRQFFTDMSLRVTARGGNEGNPVYWGALLSHGQGKAYSARVFKDGKGELHLLMPGGSGAGKVLQTFTLPAGFDYAARHTLEFRAIGDELTFIFDDAKLGSVRDSTLTGGRSPSFDGAVGSLIKKFEYKSIPKLSSSPAPDDGGGPWVDAIAEWLANPGNASSGKLKPEGTGWRMEKGGSVEISTNHPGRVMADVAVRTIWRDATAMSINLRAQTTGDMYSATLWDNGTSKILVTLDKKLVERPGIKPLPGFKAGEVHTLEFRAQGDVLTMMVDGQVTDSVKDATLTSGKCVVMCSGAWLEKIEYRDLPATPPSATTNSSVTVPAAPAATPPAPDARPPDPKLAALLPNYTKAITNGLASAAAADKPAFEAELARLKNNTPLPDAADDAKLPAELKRLRGILRAQLK